MHLLYRNAYKNLLTWKASPRRKPLILFGARQVGKTSLLKSFGKHEYAQIAYLNFEEDSNLDTLFAGKLDPAQILEKLQFYLNTKIEPSDTLIIFDEVQRSANALNSLKYFNEKANQYHIACAGSYLGLTMSSPGSFPVGKVNFETLYPLTFFEFLEALGRSSLVQLLEKELREKKISSALHEDLVQLLRIYFYVGGMPEAISVYVDTKDVSQVRTVQNEIITAYLSDFSKYAESGDVAKIIGIWNSIPAHLAKENKKFMFSAVRPSARARDYEAALQWLVTANQIFKVTHTQTIKLPLSAYVDDNFFKTYLLDVGLLGCMVNLSSKTVMVGHDLFVEFKGALVENFVGQELRAHGLGPLYYWTSGSSAEVDYLIEKDGEIWPIEVKAGPRFRAASLQAIGKHYNFKQLTVCSLSAENTHSAMTNLPLYAIGLFGGARDSIPDKR